MYFDWGEPGSQWDPPQPAAWYCSECGVEKLATKEEIHIISALEIFELVLFLGLPF